MRRTFLLVVITVAFPAFAFSQVAKTDAKKDVEQSLIKLDRDLLDSMLRKDRAMADRVEVADHVFVNPGGGVEIRGQQAQTGPVIETVDTSDAVVHSYGDTAVLVGKAMVKGRFTNGPDISGPYRYMRVFAKQGGEWRLIATTVTPIKSLGPANATPKD